MENLEHFMALRRHFYYFFYFIAEVSTWALFYVACSTMLCFGSWYLFSFLDGKAISLFWHFIERCSFFINLQRNFQVYIFIKNQQLSISVITSFVCKLYSVDCGCPNTLSKKNIISPGHRHGWFIYHLRSRRKKVNPLCYAISDLH